VRYWRLVAEAVAGHPSAFGFELANEPMTIRRGAMFDAWKAGSLVSCVASGQNPPPIDERVTVMSAL